MPAVHRHLLVVTEYEIDPQGHANNIRYFDWLQAAAIAHSSLQGWPPSSYRERGWAWVVRSHYIEYRRPAFAGDELTVKTWVADMARFTSRRRFEISRDSKLIARAETNWAFVETNAGKLMPIPEEVFSAFELVPDEK